MSVDSKPSACGFSWFPLCSLFLLLGSSAHAPLGLLTPDEGLLQQFQLHQLLLQQLLAVVSYELLELLGGPLPAVLHVIRAAVFKHHTHVLLLSVEVAVQGQGVGVEVVAVLVSI